MVTCVKLADRFSSLWSESPDLESLVLCLVLCCVTLGDIEKMKLKLCLGSARTDYPDFEGGWKSRKRKKMRQKWGAEDESEGGETSEADSLFLLCLCVCSSVTPALVDREVEVHVPEGCLTPCI